MNREESQSITSVLSRAKRVLSFAKKPTRTEGAVSRDEGTCRWPARGGVLVVKDGAQVWCDHAEELKHLAPYEEVMIVASTRRGKGIPPEALPEGRCKLAGFDPNMRFDEDDEQKERL